MSRAALHAPVYFIEEPVFASIPAPALRTTLEQNGVKVLTPVFPHDFDRSQGVSAQRLLLDQWLADNQVSNFISWYYTPMALLFSEHLRPRVTVYDCMDQLSAFQGAPPELVEQEESLFARADVVFTGGRSLFEDKQGKHANVHLFPSSVDVGHFSSSRTQSADLDDQSGIGYPRIGFFGVLDERLDQELLRELAAGNPSWQFVLIGPVVKIREDELPRAANIHYLGPKHYDELPGYLAHWDVAILPFAQNASTRFISPTKTPEYLAAGKPVVSTPIRDVVEPYGRLGLARIAATAEEFSAGIAAALGHPVEDWLPAVDEFLSHTSWDRTFEEMWHEVMRAYTDAAVDETSEEVMDV